MIFAPDATPATESGHLLSRAEGPGLVSTAAQWPCAQDCGAAQDEEGSLLHRTFTAVKELVTRPPQLSLHPGVRGASDSAVTDGDRVDCEAMW